MLERLGNDSIDKRLSGKTSRSEIAQMTIVAAMQHFEQFRGLSLDEFRAWLLQILDNLVTDTNRRYLQSLKRSIHLEEPICAAALAQDMLHPSQIAMSAEEHQRLLVALEQLPDDLRQIVQLRYWGDLTFPEIAERLVLSTATARRRWLEAIEQLSRFLEA